MIGIIGAMALEVENLVSELSDRESETILGITFHRGKLCGKDVVLAVCGIGKCFAAICAQTMILKYQPEFIINIGVAGALSATLGVAGAILVESSLSFLGLGVQPPDASWGNMLMEGKNVLEIAPWLSLWPGLAILVTVLGYNLLGESLRDILDPRLRER